MGSTETAFRDGAKAARPPLPLAYAASAHLRVVDLEAGRVVARHDLHRAVRDIAVTADGRRVFVAASDGVRVFDGRTHALLARWTGDPARSVELDATESRLFVLEHRVRLEDDQSARRRFVEPFRLLTFDVDDGTRRAREDVGDRILYARPAVGPGLCGIRVTERSEVFVVQGGAAPGVFGLALPRNDLRFRKEIARDGHRLYVPGEGVPSGILELDLETQEARTLDLGMLAAVRGAAALQGQDVLMINTGESLLQFDLRTERVTGRLALDAPHVGLSVSADGRVAVLAQTIDGTGGAVTAVDLDRLEIAARVHLEDISPWAIALVPRP